MSELPTRKFRPMCLSDVRAALAHPAYNIDWSGMNRVYDVAPDHALVDAGATWRTLLQATLRRGATPLCLPRSANLMVCQTLRVGDTLLHGRECGPRDPISALHVMTPSGLITCSQELVPELFDAMRAGTGPRDHAVVRVGVRLQDAPTYAQRVRLFYRHASRCAHDTRVLRSECRFDCISAAEMNGAERAQNLAWIAASGRDADGPEPRYMIEAMKCFDPGEEPRVDELLSGLVAPPDAARYDTLSFADYALRMTATAEAR